jgi:low temperature requirement protein LtrA
MLAVGALAISIPPAFRGSILTFTISFLVIQGVIIYLLGSIAFYDRSHVKLSRPFLLHYCISFIILMLALLCSYRVAMGLMLLAIIINLSAPVFNASYLSKVLASRRRQFSASPALLERFGQFTIIVLTESILNTVSGFSLVNSRNLLVWCSLCLSIGIAFMLWSIYFDMTNEQELKKGYRYYQYFVFIHLLLLGALGTFGACLKNLVTHIEKPVPLELNRVLVVSLAVFLAAMCMIGRLIENAHRQTRNYLRQVIRWNIIVIFLLVAILFIRETIPVVNLLLVLFLLLALPVVMGIVTWLKHEDHSENPEY